MAQQPKPGNSKRLHIARCDFSFNAPVWWVSPSGTREERRTLYTSPDSPSPVSRRGSQFTLSNKRRRSQRTFLLRAVSSGVDRNPPDSENPATLCPASRAERHAGGAEILRGFFGFYEEVSMSHEIIHYTNTAAWQWFLTLTLFAPLGTPDSSPPIYRWGQRRQWGQSRQGR